MFDNKPLQVRSEVLRRRQPPCVPTAVHVAAYEVYSALFGEQPHMLEGDCRGGFGAEELIALLYAKSFPRDQWRARVDDCLESGDLRV